VGVRVCPAAEGVEGWSESRKLNTPSFRIAILVGPVEGMMVLLTRFPRVPRSGIAIVNERGRCRWARDTDQMIFGVIRQHVIACQGLLAITRDDRRSMPMGYYHFYLNK
jgi:hypothetical protein